MAWIQAARLNICVQRHWTHYTDIYRYTLELYMFKMNEQTSLKWSCCCSNLASLMSSSLICAAKSVISLGGCSGLALPAASAFPCWSSRPRHAMRCLGLFWYALGSPLGMPFVTVGPVLVNATLLLPGLAFRGHVCVAYPSCWSGWPWVFCRFLLGRLLSCRAGPGWFSAGSCWGGCSATCRASAGSCWGGCSATCCSTAVHISSILILGHVRLKLSCNCITSILIRGRWHQKLHHLIII